MNKINKKLYLTIITTHILILSCVTTKKSNKEYAICIKNNKNSLQKIEEVIKCVSKESNKQVESFLEKELNNLEKELNNFSKKNTPLSILNSLPLNKNKIVLTKESFNEHTLSLSAIIIDNKNLNNSDENLIVNEQNLDDLKKIYIKYVKLTFALCCLNDDFFDFLEIYNKLNGLKYTFTSKLKDFLKAKNKYEVEFDLFKLCLFTSESKKKDIENRLDRIIKYGDSSKFEYLEKTNNIMGDFYYFEIFQLLSSDSENSENSKKNEPISKNSESESEVITKLKQLIYLDHSQKKENSDEENTMIIEE